MTDCFNCKKFWSCIKSVHEWRKIRSLYPITPVEVLFTFDNLNRVIIQDDPNLDKRLDHMEIFAKNCPEMVLV